ncbi:MAG: anaerobic ribonucleoside-triphosphate reductase activating protein [Ruminococcaceae bacterium]|nr:anaerobic ribonucleoside-triphosphate reductase activating protein [Oscillospiraceae bacterium]
MNYAEIKYNDIANGEGVRTSLFVSGCRHHCKNCFNQMTWDFGYGKAFTNEVQEKIFASLEPGWINGLSLLGGEPFEPENQETLLAFLKEFHRRFPKKDVWCYSGFTYEEITGQTDKKSRCFTNISKELLKNIDILVDGRYVEELHDIRLKFRGSSNQRVIDVKQTMDKDEIVLHLE